MMKRKYFSPKIELIRLANEKSLQLASSPTISDELEQYDRFSSPQNDLDMEMEAYSYENW